ncbi:MBL fold metallo-hydrolase [Streptomyces noursei]|uniref:MBL fold metallo-hydrolase n=1 Tax=Streptomyces noursei TaxID=1971 RepID=UPI003800E807
MLLQPLAEAVTVHQHAGRHLGQGAVGVDQVRDYPVVPLSQSCGHRVLIDPVLKSVFGLPGRAECRVWPPRAIDAGLMPRPDAVVLTHEHLDHFHLPSLDLLDRQVPIYTGPLLPAPVEEAIAKLGFTECRIDRTAPIELGDLCVTLYPAGVRTLFWEDRVVQPCLRVGDGPSVFIAVDADPSDLYLQQVAEGSQPVPRVAVVSNDSQIVPPGMPASSINLLPGMDGTRHKTGLSMLNQLLLEVLAPLDGIKDVALCGNGFLPLPRRTARSSAPATRRWRRPATACKTSSGSTARARESG